MRRASFIFLIIMVFLSCSNETKLSKGILDKEKMQAVIWDMIRAEEFLNNFVFSRDTSINKTSESLLWFDKIYEFNNITKAEFEKSYDYYRAHPVLMQEILDSLAKKHADMDGQKRYQAPLVPPATPVSAEKIDSIKNKLSRFSKKDKKSMIIADSLLKGLPQ